MLSALDRLLLAAAAPGTFDPAELLPVVRGAGIPWSQALRLAASNRVASFVAQLVETELLASCIDAAVHSEWRVLRMLQVFRKEAAERQLHELGEALGRAGVAPIVYKGLDFQALCYPEAYPRAFSDLDIIVRREDTARAAAALEAAGYSAESGARPLDYYRRFHLHASYVHPDHRPCVELHWALDSPFGDALDPIPLLFDAAERGGPFGADVLRPAPIDALALMAIHLEKHLGLSATLPSAEARLKSVIDESGLIWVLDIVRWMRTQSAAADGDAVLRRVRQLGAERSLVIALRLARDLDPPSLRGWACELAARLPSGRPLLSRLVYPDLSAGRSVTPGGRQRRAFLLSMHPRLGFRPVRVLESLLPPFRVPGTARRTALARCALLVRRGARLAANLLAIRRDRGEPARAPGLWLILVSYALFGLGYSALMPMWEAADEPDHYRVALYVARNGTSPPPGYSTEAAQPPLYYWLASAPLALLGKLDAALVDFHGPELRRRDAVPRLAWNARNYRFLWGAQILRWIDVALGGVALVLMFRGARRLFPGCPTLALATPALAGLTPQFLHVSASITNDALANLAGALLFWLLGVVCSTPLGPLAAAGAAATALAAPLLTKLTVLPMALTLCVAITWQTRNRWRMRWPYGVAGAALVLASVALAVVLPTSGALGELWSQIAERGFRVRPEAFAYLDSVPRQFTWSYWGLVGWMSVPLPANLPNSMTALAAAGGVASLLLLPSQSAGRYGNRPLALAGLLLIWIAAILANSWLACVWAVALVWLLHRRLQHPSPIRIEPTRAWGFLWICIALSVLAVLKNWLATPQAQGRFVFPAIGAISLLITAGWFVLLPARARPLLPYLIVLALAGVNLAFWLTRIIPLYYQPFLD